MSLRFTHALVRSIPDAIDFGAAALPDRLPEIHAEHNGWQERAIEPMGFGATGIGLLARGRFLNGAYPCSFRGRSVRAG